MKTLFTAIAMFAIAALISLPLSAAPGTLYQQEGTANDGPSGINAAGQGPHGDNSNNWTNWQYQYGSASWSGVYAGDNGWMTESESGDPGLDVEADIEMYCSETISGNKIYFHLGNLYTATPGDMRAFVNGSFTSNNGMYIGLSFAGSSKGESDFDLTTGVITDAMVSDRDTWRTQDNYMDVSILLNDGTGWRAADDYGDGAHATIQDTLWWLIAGGAAGTHSYQWMIQLLPDTDQPDGDYHLDPEIVVAPVL